MHNDRLFLNEISQIHSFRNVPQCELYELDKAIQLITVGEEIATFFDFEPELETHYIIPISGRLLIIHDNINERRPFSLQLPQGSMWPITAPECPDKAIGIQAVNPGQAAKFSSKSLHKILQKSPNLRKAIYESIGLGWQSLTEQASRKANLSLFSQIALLFLDYKIEENGQHVVRLAHWQLALLLSSHRETISTELQKMKRLGIIETGRKKIVLTNINLLLKIGNDEWHCHRSDFQLPNTINA